MSDDLLWILLTQLPILREILKKVRSDPSDALGSPLNTIRPEEFVQVGDTDWSLISSHPMRRDVGCDAEQIEVLIRFIFSSSFFTAMDAVYREWRCSVDFATGLQSPEGRRWDCNLAARLWRNSLTFVVIGYTDQSVVIQSGANVRSRFKEFIDSRRWIGFIRKSSLVDFAKAMTLFYRGVMLLLLTSL